MREMMRQPKVVVGEIADEGAPGVPRQHFMAVYLSEPRAFGKVEEGDACIRLTVPGHDLPRLLRNPVADDKKLEVAERLRKRTMDRAVNERPMVMRRHDNAHERGGTGQLRNCWRGLDPFKPISVEAPPLKDLTKLATYGADRCPWARTCGSRCNSSRPTRLLQRLRR